MLQGTERGFAGNKECQVARDFGKERGNSSLVRSLPIVIPMGAYVSHGSPTAGADGRFRGIAGSAESSTFEANLGL